MNPFRHFGRSPRAGDRPIARPVPTQDNTTQTNVVVHPCLEQLNINVLMKSRREGDLSGHVARVGQIRNVYKILVEKPEGKIPLQKCGPKWEDCINVDSTEMGPGVTDCIQMTQGVVANTIRNLQIS